MGKAIITVTQDENTQTFKGDTVLAFTVDHKNLPVGKPKVVNANAIYMGSDIPYEIFPKLIGTLVASFIKQRGTQNEDCPLHTAFVLDEVSKVIKSFSKEILDDVPKEDMEEELKAQVHKLADDFLQHIFEEGLKE